MLHKWLGREPSLEWDRSALLNTPTTVRERNGAFRPSPQPPSFFMLAAVVLFQHVKGESFQTTLGLMSIEWISDNISRNL